MIFCIIKNNYVVNRINAESIDFIIYPFDYDLIVEDINSNIHIGDWYEEKETLFYRPIGVPNDWPEELLFTDEKPENE